jgi:hypothetical protein
LETVKKVRVKAAGKTARFEATSGSISLAGGLGANGHGTTPFGA